LTFIVQADGSVDNVQVVSSSNEVFVNAAVRSVKQWRFEPGTKNGRVVATRVRLPVAFRME
jgi:protein TonB